jgi:hypothetical protein
MLFSGGRLAAPNLEGGGIDPDKGSIVLEQSGEDEDRLHLCLRSNRSAAAPGSCRSRTHARGLEQIVDGVPITWPG